MEDIKKKQHFIAALAGTHFIPVAFILVVIEVLAYFFQPDFFEWLSTWRLNLSHIHSFLIFYYYIWLPIILVLLGLISATLGGLLTSFEMTAGTLAVNTYGSFLQERVIGKCMKEATSVRTIRTVIFSFLYKVIKRKTIEIRKIRILVSGDETVKTGKIIFYVTDPDELLRSINLSIQASHKEFS